MSDSKNRILSFGEEGPLSFERKVMVKTGTSTDYKDNWAVAVLPNSIVGTWVGNFDGSPLKEVSGVQGAAPIMHRVTEHLINKNENIWTEKPDNIVERRYCALSGKTPSKYCPHQVSSEISVLKKTDEICDWHDQDGVNWPDEYWPWLEANNQSTAIAKIDDRNLSAELRILSPSDGDVYKIQNHLPSAYQSIKLRANTTGPVEWFLNQEKMDSNNSRVEWVLQKGSYLLEVQSDSGRDAIRFEVR